MHAVVVIPVIVPVQTDGKDNVSTLAAMGIVAAVIVALWIVICAFVAFTERNDCDYSTGENFGFWKPFFRNVFTAAWVRCI